MLIFRVCFDKVGGNLCRAGQSARKAGALHGVQRQEGGAPGALILQKADGGAGTALILDHDVLQRKAECGLDGGLVALFDREDTGHRADDAPQAACPGRPHDRLDALLVAVHVALQVLKDMDALGGGGFFAVGLLQGLGGVRLLAAAAVQLEL